MFLCTGNACRSQIAEGWARALANKEVVVGSAGIAAHGLNPRAVQVMTEAGVDISGQRSKVVTGGDVERFDLIVTVCGHADEHCPVVPARVEKVHWPLLDPARAQGNADEIDAVFRACRDDIRGRVRTLLTRYDCLNPSSADGLTLKRW